MSTRCSRWICVFCLPLLSGLAQQNHRMTLDVVVTDKSGKPIPGLQQQDFTLLDNKLQQKIVSFHAVAGATADPPVEVILLIDDVNATFSNVATERDQIEKFLRQNGGQLAHPLSLAFLGDSGTTMGNTPSQDGNAVLAELNQKSLGLRTIGRAQGFNGADERLDLSLRALGNLAAYETPRPGRKLVVWISPGWPFLSGPGIELSSKQRAGIFGSAVRISDELRQARITLYNVDPLGVADAAGFRTSEYKVFLKGLKAPGQAEIGNLALQVLASQSGGRVLNSTNNVEGEIAMSVADADAFYVLSFEYVPGDGPDEYHALDIKVDKPGLTARTRAGYYAQPEHP